jgi:hypothetical protein
MMVFLPGVSPRGLLLLVTLCSLCSCSSPQASKGAYEKTIVIEARTSLGEVVKGALVNAVVHGADAPEPPVLQTEPEQGRTQITSRSNEALEITASCPEGYRGDELRRTLSASLLRASSAWHMKLLCEPVHVLMSVGVLGPECGEIALRMDGQDIGSTQSGVLHAVIPITPKENAEISAHSVNEKCVLVNPQQVFDLSAEAPHIVAQFEAVKPKKVRVRSHRVKPVAPSRPYRL